MLPFLLDYSLVLMIITFKNYKCTVALKYLITSFE